MLVSYRHKFLVALPTKCGTISMRDMAFKWERDGGDPAVIRELPELRHRMDIPEGCEDYKRFIMIRNPYDRLLSSFNYILHHKNEWKTDELQKRLADEFDGNEVLLFRWWLKDLLKERNSVHNRSAAFRVTKSGKRPYIWVDRLSELRDFVGGRNVDGSELPWSEAPVGLIRLEHVHKDWHAALRTVGVKGGIAGLEVPHHNKATRKAETYGKERSLAKWFGTGSSASSLVGGDAEEFGYTGLNI